MPWLSIEKFVRYSSFVTADCAYLSTHTVYQYKIVFSLFGGDMAILENGYRKTSFT